MIKEGRQNQLKAIKQRICQKFNPLNQDGLSINKLKDELNKICDFEINYDTLAHTLDVEHNSLDMYCVIALCRYFNLDIAYVLSEPDNPASAMYEETQFVSERYTILDDPKYMGTYYGYFYSPKKTCEMIDDFKLVLKKEHGKTVAKLTINYHSLDRGVIKISNKQLEGTPILVKPSNIYIVFTEGAGQFLLMSFSYVHYNVNNLYFRRGAIITLGRDATRQPLMQSFALFANELSPDFVEKYIPGFLLLYDTVFHIKANTLDLLAKENEDIAYLLNDFGYIFKANCEYYYKVNEAQILASVRHNIPKKDIVKALQIMKAYADDAKRVYFPEIDDFSEFSKYLGMDEL